jgi:hypothetical protein
MGTGNGCTNLDDATFGTTFRNSTDTGSNYIGGLQSAVPHDYICYTGFGERVDLCGWSENVYSCGYGSAFSGTGSAEWYASGFNGTSSASPIVAGCAGVVNNVYRDLHAGANIAPLDMRYYLNDYGTVPNSQPGNIGVMPNLRGVLAPELNPKWPTGWDGYAVPRNTNDATGSYAPLPTNLNSTPSNTYWNAAVENTAPIGTANGADWRVYRDDVWIVVAADNFPPNSWHWFENVNFESSTQVRGGRHAVRLITDYDDVVVEADETNNANTRQFVWDPVILTDDSPVIYSRPPVKTATGQSGSDYNCDGFARSTSAGYWEILAVQSATSTADYDARIYSEAVTSTNGFDTYEEWSAGAGNGYIDFVGINNNIQAGTLLASVVNYDGETADYSVEVQGSTVLSPSTPAPGRNNYGSFSIGGDELFEVWEFYGAASTTYTIEVDVTSGSADMVISVFGPSNDYFSRNQAIASSNANNGAGDEVLTFTPADAGWYGIVVHKDDYNDWQQNASFNLYVGQALSDMTHALRSGWSHQIVVRQSSGGDPAVLPATLDGNISTNYVNASYINQGGIANTAGVVRDSFYVDGKGRYLSNTFASWAPGTVVSWYNLNLGFIFGGRHSVGDIVDALELEPEWIETNNRHDEQFVWSPYPISNLSTYGISAAPNYLDGLSSVYFTSFNVDAFQFIGTYWSGVGMTPQDPDDEYNCYLYAAPTTSTSGLSTRLVNSWATGSNTEWVLENGNINGNPATYNVGVNNNWPWPGTPSQDSYRIWQSNSITDLNVDFVNGPYTLPNNGLIHVFDLYLTAGETTRILLDNQSAVDLGFAIYDPMVQYASRVSGGSVVNVNADGLDEALEYTPANSGYHGLVVFKQDYTDMPAASYRLIIGNRTPMPPTELTLLWVQHSPSVHECLMTWDPVTQDIFGNPLTVDTYDLYYTLDPSAEYNTGWLPGGSVPGAVNQTPIYIPDTWEQARFIFVARDEDGLAAAIIGTTGDDSRELLNTLEELPRRQDGAVRLIRSDEHR